MIPRTCRLAAPPGPISPHRRRAVNYRRAARCMALEAPGKTYRASVRMLRRLRMAAANQCPAMRARPRARADPAHPAG